MRSRPPLRADHAPRGLHRPALPDGRARGHDHDHPDPGPRPGGQRGLPYAVTCLNGSYDLGFANPSLDVDGLTFRVSARVLLDVPPRLAVSAVRATPRRATFTVRASGPGRLAVALRSPTVRHTYALHQGINKLSLRLPEQPPGTHPPDPNLTHGPSRKNNAPHIIVS